MYTFTIPIVHLFNPLFKPKLKNYALKNQKTVQRYKAMHKKL